ncbi:MAG: TolC family protein [Pantoea dispersa]|nr:TolC family protein [Pantoea dispersa]MBZ6392451.1 TolC family protein [Pantoea dispersa]
MKTLKPSRRVLPLLVGSLLALESYNLYANDELLMFVEVSKTEPETPASDKPIASISANAMAKMLEAQSRPASVKSSPQIVARPTHPVVTPAKRLESTVPALNAPTLPAAPLMHTSAPILSATPDKPLFAANSDKQTSAPIKKAAVPTRIMDPVQPELTDAPIMTSAPTASATSNEVPVFRPAPLQQSVVSTPLQASEPMLTPTPKLSVLPAPQSITSISPGEVELRRIFYNAVTTALERSPQIRSARLQVDAAKEDVSNAKGQRWPQVDVSSNSRSYEFGGGARNASESNMPTFGVNVATNLIDFGQTSNTIKSKEFSVKAADFQSDAQIEDLAWKVSSGLVELSKQRLIIEMSKQYVARMQELVTMLSGIVQADQGRRSELTQATGRFLQAQSALDSAVSRARDTEIVLYRLIGETQVPLPPAMQWQLSTSQVDRLLAMVDRHPTLEQARAQSAAAFAEADALKSSALPKLNWVVSKNTAKDYQGREQSWQTGLNVSWGLFRGGSAKAAEQAAVQRAAALREQSEDQRDDLQQRVRAADQDARSMLQRADLYRNLTRESDRIRLDFFDQWYHLGKRTLLDVLSAESDYYNNRVAEVTNRFDGYSAIFRGYASAGQLVNWLKNTPVK